MEDTELNDSALLRALAELRATKRARNEGNSTRLRSSIGEPRSIMFEYPNVSETQP